MKRLRAAVAFVGTLFMADIFLIMYSAWALWLILCGRKQEGAEALTDEAERWYDELWGHVDVLLGRDE